MANNKVNFGLKNLYYAMLTATTNEQGVTTYTWGTPVRVPGAVSIDLSNDGEMTPFYADNVVYYSTASAGGYSGSVEVAKVPDQMLTDVWGDKADATTGVMYEGAAVSRSFALMFEFSGDIGPERYVLYNVTASRPGISSETTTESTDPNTVSFDIRAAALDDNFGTIQAHTNDSTQQTTYNGWFGAVVYTDQGAASAQTNKTPASGK